MIQHQAVNDTLTIEVNAEEHEKIKIFADSHGNSINEYVLESVRERMSHQKEKEDLLKITTSINPVLKELWDNDKVSKILPGTRLSPFPFFSPPFSPFQGGRFTWTAPNTPSESCLVRISGADTPGEPADVSNNLFSITSN